MAVSRSIFYQLFFVVLLTTEFYYIEVGGGIARLYHFFAVLVVISLFRSIPLLFKSKVFLALLFFVMINLLAVSLSDQPGAALASLTSLLANLAVAMATALILVRNKIDLDAFKRLLINLTLLSVVWGVIQIIAASGGLVLALSQQQEAQIQIGFGPGFRTEANAFGKYMLLPFLLFLPAYLKNPRNRKLRYAYLIMTVGILMNFTRSAIYGLMVALLFVFMWYAVQGKLALVFTRAAKIAMVVALGLALMLSGAVQTSGYAIHKLENFFNKEEILEGGSSAYRLMAMEAVIDSTVNDSKRLIIGNGWGQTYVEIQGQVVQAGGADFVNCLGFGGIAGVLCYLLYSWLALLTLARAARRTADPDQAMIAEGLLFAFVGMFVTGMMSGYLISPEYWILIGASIYVGIIGKSRRKPVGIA